MKTNKTTWLVLVSLNLIDSDCRCQENGAYKTHYKNDRMSKYGDYHSINFSYFAIGKKIELETTSSTLRGTITKSHGIKTVKTNLWPGGGVWADRRHLLIEMDGVYEGPAITLAFMGQGCGSPGYSYVPKGGYDRLFIKSSLAEVPLLAEEYYRARKTRGLPAGDCELSNEKCWLIREIEQVILELRGNEPPVPKKHKVLVWEQDIIPFTQGFEW